MPDDPSQERQQEGQHDMQAHQSDEDPATRKVDRKLLEILVCPLTKTTLQYDAKAQELISPAAKLAYPIRGGIPILLEEEARRLED